MRRLLVVLSITSLCLFAGLDARLSRAEISALRNDGNTLASMPVVTAAQLAASIPTKTLRTPHPLVFATLPAVLVLLAMSIAAATRRRRSIRARLDRRAARPRGPPSRLRPLIIAP